MIVFGPWEPDKGPLNGTSIDTVVNCLPLSNGWGPMPDTTVFTLALPSECKGAWWYRTSAGVFNMVAATQTHLYKLNASSLDWDHASQIAADTITNGVFAADTDWTKGTGVTIAGDKGVFTAVAAGEVLSQVATITGGDIYKVVFTISGYTAGGVTPKFTGGTTVSGTNRTANGTYTEYLTGVTGNTTFALVAVGASTSLSVDNVTMQALTTYSGPDTGELWTATLFGDNFYVTNINDPLQYIDIDAGTNFDDAPGSPPQAKYIAGVGDFLFLANLEVTGTPYPRKWHHCAINDPTDWTISGVSGDSDDQEIPDAEEIVGIISMAGSNARIIQRSARRQLLFSPGSNPVFQQLDVDSPTPAGNSYGAVAPAAIVPLGGDRYFFLNETGFYMNDEHVPIGADRVNEWFLADCDPAKLYAVQAAADPGKHIIWVRYQDQSGTYKMIGYDWLFDRWTYSDIPCQLLVSTATPGVVLDDLTSTLDSYSEPLDSPFWEGGEVTFGCFREDDKLYLFAAEKADATIETNTMELSPNVMTWVTGALLKGNLSGYRIAVGKTMHASTVLSWSALTTRSERTGMVPFRASGRYHRFRVAITAGGAGTHIHGIEPLFKSTGVLGGP